MPTRRLLFLTVVVLVVYAILRYVVGSVNQALGAWN
jgi:hypothetical protein